MDYIENSNLINFPQKIQNENGDPTDNQGPIEKQMRYEISKLENCSYNDNFDWSIYDKIAKRYEKNPPRGGVVFKTTFKLVNYHTSCNKCHYAFEIDTYGRGCIHDCVYCYAKDTLTKHGFWNRPIPFPVDIASIRKTFYTVFETNKKNKWRDILEKKVPIRIGSMSDSFMLMDKKYKVTLELLNILKHYQYPYIIFTRSDLVAHEEYMKAMDPKLVSVQFSISGNNENLMSRIEPGAPSYKRRLKALKTLNDSGFWTTVRVNPLFPRHPDGYYSDKKSVIEKFGSLEDAPVLDLLNEDFLPEIKEAGVPSLLAGFVRLSTTAIRTMSKSLDIDLASFYKKEYMEARGDKRYSDKEIFQYYWRMKKDCEKHGIRFNTCYIGNGEKDYYQYQDMWDNKGDCCDAVGNVEAFKKTSQQIDWKERFKHASGGNKCIAEKSFKEDKKMREKYKDIIEKHKDNQRPLPDLSLD